MSKYVYSRESLAEAVRDNVSVMGVMRTLGIKMAGGSHYHLSNRIKREGLDTSHFTGQAHNKGKISNKRKTAAEILVLRESGSVRTKVEQLRRALDEMKVEYRCSDCYCETHNNKPIMLEVDHINGKDWDNRLENLRYLCPNCHSQQDTGKSWKYRSEKLAPLTKV